MNRTPESPVAIVGSRDFPDLDRVRAFVRSLPQDACVISGGAKGVDQAAESEALQCGLAVRSFRPFAIGHRGEFAIEVYTTMVGAYSNRSQERGRYPNFAVAAHTRNQLIVNSAASVVAFWDGKSKGTKSTIDKALAAGILFEVFKHEPHTVSRR